MKTFKIKGLNCYITLDEESIKEFNIDSEYTGIVANYEDVAKYFLAQSELLRYKEPFEIEEVKLIEHELCVLFANNQ